MVIVVAKGTARTRVFLQCCKHCLCASLCVCYVRLRLSFAYLLYGICRCLRDSCVVCHMAYALWVLTIAYDLTYAWLRGVVGFDLVCMISEY